MSKVAPSFRVLCVDDNPSLLQVLKTSLEHYGCEIVTAGHGIEALREFKAHSGDFAAIVTDHDMPQMNGAEFVRSVRGIGFQGRIVVMSGRLTVEDLGAYQDHAISGFFHKPFEMSLLAAMLMQASCGHSLGADPSTLPAR
jgi:CheY-like chemotaxis protein